VKIAQAVVACCTLAGVVLAAPSGHWDLPLLGLLLALAILSDRAAVTVGSSKIEVSGSFTAIVLGMVLLGGAPAAVLGALTSLVTSVRTREAFHAARQNLLVFTLYPLAGGVAFSALASSLNLDSNDPAYFVAVLGVFMLALALNFSLIAAYASAIGRAPFLQSVRDAFLPLLASELTTALLTLMSVFLYERAGFAAMVLVGVAVIAFQHLLAMLLLSQQREQQLHEQARSDELTGLGNRRRLLEDLEDAFAAAIAGENRLLITFDLDGFKQYNDAFGHPEGDLLLNRLGKRLEDAVQGYGSAYRLGGDEFCVLVKADPPGGLVDQDRLVQVTQSALGEEGPGFSVRSSHGVVRLGHEAADASNAMRLADQRMYACKASRPTSVKRQARNLLLTVLAEQQPDLHEHLGDVAKLAAIIANDLGMAEADADDVAQAAELHDVGKVAIPAEILAKPGPLDEEEWHYMRRHTLIGERILAAVPSLGSVARIVRSSHERWDGQGYPDGLAGEQIPLGARIVAVCDAYDAIRAQRSYKPAQSEEFAIAELRRCAGTQFDPVVVEAFIRLRARVRAEEEARKARDNEAKAVRSLHAVDDGPPLPSAPSIAATSQDSPPGIRAARS
jgi:diguanylate cyclase (GGDEF)-like protein